MPMHTYRAERRPPTVLDHFLAHPYELPIAAWQVLVGLGCILAALSPSATVSPSLDDLHPLLAGGVGVALLGGGVAIWCGLLDDSEDLMIGWRKERPGLILSGSAFLSYTVAVLAVAPASVIAWSFSLVSTISMVLRYIATRRSERDLRQAIQ